MPAASVDHFMAAHMPAQRSSCDPRALQESLGDKSTKMCKQSRHPGRPRSSHRPGPLRHLRTRHEGNKGDGLAEVDCQQALPLPLELVAHAQRPAAQGVDLGSWEGRVCVFKWTGADPGRCPSQPKGNSAPTSHHLEVRHAPGTRSCTACALSSRWRAGSLHRRHTAWEDGAGLLSVDFGSARHAFNLNYLPNNSSSHCRSGDWPSWP